MIKLQLICFDYLREVFLFKDFREDIYRENGPIQNSEDNLKRLTNFFIGTYFRTALVSVFFLLFSYYCGLVSLVCQNDLSIYDIVEENFQLVLITFLPFVFLMGSVVGIVLYWSYAMRNLFLGVLKKKQPDVYRMIQSAGFRGILGSKKISRDKGFLLEYTKSSFMFLFQILLFITYSINHMEFQIFFKIFFVISLFLIFFSFIFKLYLSVFNCIVFPLFFMAFSVYFSFQSHTNELDLILIYILSCTFTFVYVTTQIINISHKKLDNIYGMNVMVISACTFPLWKVYIFIIFQSLGIYHIKDAKIAKIDTKNEIHKGFIVMETPNKIIWRDSIEPGPQYVLNKNSYYIMKG